MPPTKRVAKRVASTTPRPDPDPEPEDDDAEPQGNGDDAPKMKSPLRPGSWGGAQQVMDSTSSYAQAFRPGERIDAIKFLQDSPYTAFRRHWHESIGQDGQRMVRAYTCALSYDSDCPLCEAGNKPQAVSAFNVALLDENGGVSLKSWDVGARIFNVLKSYANDPKIGPLTRGYFVVSKSGKKQNTQYNIIPVKESSLTEDYGFTPPSEEDLRRLVLYTVDIVEITPKSKLRELAAEMADYE